MTDRRHSRAPLRRSSTPERILSAGLATATCVGVVGRARRAHRSRPTQPRAGEPTTEQSTPRSPSTLPPTVIATEPTTVERA